jgi:hypothetical protein
LPYGPGDPSPPVGGALRFASIGALARALRSAVAFSRLVASSSVSTSGVPAGRMSGVKVARS